MQPGSVDWIDKKLSLIYLNSTFGWKSSRFFIKIYDGK
jgi:hypothetical protein